MLPSRAWWRLATLAAVAAWPLVAWAEALPRLPDELPPELPGPALQARPNVAGAPFVRYSPETAWGFGAAGLAWFHADPVARASGRATTVGAAFQRTSRHQTVAAGLWDAYLAEGRWRSSGSIFAERWPYDFWGAGAVTRPDGEDEDYTQRSFKLETGLERRVLDAGAGGGLWLGGRARWRRDQISDALPGGLVDRCAVAGCRGGRVAALQAVVAWDTRDRVCAPGRGLLLTARAGGAAAALGSQLSFAELELDARGWVPLPWRRAVASAQARLHSTSGEVPFYMLPTFGGDRSLRGVVEGRYRDRTSLLLQGELAVPVAWRFGVEVFGGVGGVAADPAGLSLRGLVPAGGAGLRYTVDPADGVIVRLDHGVARGSSQWYLSIGQAI